MKPSQNLFELIKSLNQSEKRYFKLNAASVRSGETNYIKLFLAIDAMEVYEEDLLLEQFKGTSLVKQLHVAKNYLYRIILKSLVGYHSNSSTTSKLLETLDFIEVLYGKGFYTQCEKMAVKGRKACREHELRSLELNFIEWQMKLELRKNNFTVLYEIISEENVALELIHETLDFKKQATKVFELAFQLGTIRDLSLLVPIKEKLEDPVFKKDDHLITREAQYYKYSALWHYANLTHDDAGAYDCAKKILALHDSKIGHPYSYIATLNNLCVILLRMGRIDECRNFALRLRSFCQELDPSKWESTCNTGLLMSYNIELAIYTATCDFNQVSDLVHPVDQLLQKVDILQRTLWHDLEYNLAYALFLSGNLDKSINFLTKLNNEPKSNVRIEIFVFSQLLFLVLHYELGNIKLIKNLIPPAISRIEKRTDLFRPVVTFLIFLEKYCGELEEVEHEDLLGQLMLDIKVQIQIEEDRTTQFFDMVSWIESKLLKQPFKDVMKHNIKQ